MVNCKLAKGDKGYNLGFTITDSAGTAFNLTGYTITLKVWRTDRPGTLLVNGTCTPVSEPAGTCRYAIATSDFLTTGKFMAELELTAAGVIESTENFIIEVRESG